jgi:polysaccharide export outer membrane protein
MQWHLSGFVGDILRVVFSLMRPLQMVAWLIAGFGATMVLAQEIPAGAANSLSPTQIEQMKQMSSDDVERLKLEILKTGKTPQSTPQVVTPGRPTAQSQAPVERESRSIQSKAQLNDPKEEKSIKQGLKLYGYDLFQGVPSTFAPVSEVPVTADYILGPGDTVQINTYGARNEQLSLVVSREGVITYPGIGPMNVAGQSFEAMSEMVLKRIEAQLIGVKATISMGALRSMRVFILGEATQPGTYTVSSMSTMTNALFVSGGVKTIGSLRNIALRRQGRVVATLDLYNLLMRGDTSSDIRLLPGDVIFIPKIGETVGVAGEVLRPAIYELKHEKTVTDLIGLAGGLLPTAFPQATQVERIDSHRQKTIVDADQTAGKAKRVAVQDGDMVRVYSILDRMDKIVLLSGHVHRPGGVQWRPGIRLTDVVAGFDDLLPRPETQFLIVKRELLPDRRVEFLRANLSAAMKDPDSPANLTLLPRDEVIVFAQDGDRTKTLAPLVEQIQRQARSGAPSLAVEVSGAVIAPGMFPMTADMRISDLLLIAGGLREDAYLGIASIRREVIPARSIELLPVNLRDAVYDPGSDSNIRLKPRDQLLVFPEKSDRSKLVAPLVEQMKFQARSGTPSRVVDIGGAVMFPGQYPMTNGMRISDLLLLAGEMKEEAFQPEAELTRYGVNSENLRPVEIKTINLASVLRGDKAQNVELQPFDQLFVKTMPEWATAAPEAAVFLRERLRVQEQEAIDRLAERIQNEIAGASVRSANAAAQAVGSTGAGNATASAALLESMLKTLKSTKAVGRLAIDLPNIRIDARNSRGSSLDVTLEDGDKLFVPPVQESVTISGEVNYASSHRYDPDLSFQSYLDRAGGVTQNADESRIFVIHANGAVQAASKSWLSWAMNDEDLVRPGDTIVVPPDVRQIAPIALWSSVSQIFSNVAVSLAAMKSIGIFK